MRLDVLVFCQELVYRNGFALLGLGNISVLLLIFVVEEPGLSIISEYFICPSDVYYYVFASLVRA